MPIRVWGEPRAILKYALYFTGIVDILSFLPYYLPVFFPSGAVAFRMFRVIRIFRLVCHARIIAKTDVRKDTCNYLDK